MKTQNTTIASKYLSKIVKKTWLPINNSKINKYNRRNFKMIKLKKIYS